MTIDLNADGGLVAPAQMFVNRSTHQVGSPQTGFADTFPHSNTDPAAVAFFPNPFMSNYNNMYTATDAASWSGGLAHFTGVPINAFGEPTDMSSGTLYFYVNSTTYEPLFVQEPLPDSMLAANGGDYHTLTTVGGPFDSVPIMMAFEENIWFDPVTGTVQNQIYNVTAYLDVDGDGSYEIQTDEWKGKPFNYDTLQILQDMGSIDIHNSHEIDERPYRRALFYKHFNDRLAGLHLKDQIKQMETE